jgi:phosphocarrier protein
MSKQDQKLTREVTVNNKVGLHIRAATVVAETACKYDAEVTVEKDGVAMNCRSVLSLMSLGAAKGTTLTLTANGNDAQEALDAIEQIFQDRFGEE